MKKLILVLIFQIFAIFLLAQQTILPGDISINKSLMKSYTSNMEIKILENSKFVFFGNYKMEVVSNNQQLGVHTTFTLKDKSILSKSEIVSDGNTFKPISILSKRNDRILGINFSNNITGRMESMSSGVKIEINEKSIGNYFEISTYPFILPALPLKIGYKADIPVYNYEALTPDKKYSRARIINVIVDDYYSLYSGNHPIWRVVVMEESTKQIVQFEIDQKTGKFWKVLFRTADEKQLQMTHIESDYPTESKFEKEATLKLTTQGNSIIKGQAFAKDNQAIVPGINIAKKQFAPKGTNIILTPLTDYFKEVDKVNEKNNKGFLYTPPIPLVEGAEECIKETAVIDDEGHFEFTNLMPGKYLITTSFLFSHAYSKSIIVGYSDYYLNGNFQGTIANSVSQNYESTLDANVKKVVEVKKDGETVSIKLKKKL